MAESEWKGSVLQSPPEFDRIALNAQNAINNIDTLLEIITTAGEVAKLFLALSNPAALIIRLAADEIINLCNDFNEIGMFFLLVDPTEQGVGNATPLKYGLKLPQDENGLYQFKRGFGGSEVGSLYQKTVLLADLVAYRDSNNRKQGENGFIPPTPDFPDNEELGWQLGGYNPTTWTGELPGTTKLTNGIFPPQMNPAKVLRVMSEAFDDEGDVALFDISPSDQIKYKSKKVLYDWSGEKIEMASFDITLPQTDRVFIKPIKGTDKRTGLSVFKSNKDREEITTLVTSGRPNFAGSGNFKGIEIAAVIALVGVGDYQAFVEAWENMQKVFAGGSGVNDLVKKAKALLDSANAKGEDKLTLTNDSKYGGWQVSTGKKPQYIIGKESGAVGRIDTIVSETTQNKTRIDFDGNGQPVTVDLNSDGRWRKLDILYKKFDNQSINFQAGETVWEAIAVPDHQSQRNLFAGKTGPDYPVTYNYMKKPKTGSAIPADQIGIRDVNPADLPAYGKVIGIDTSAPESIPPNFTSIKFKDMIPGYADFFEGIIGFAENMKSYADKAETFIAILIDIIDKQIERFKEIADSIKAFLQLFVDGLPEAGIYWLTIKTFGGNKAIKAALTDSDNQPPDSLKFCAGFAMVSVSGVGGRNSGDGFVKTFEGMGFEFQEVAMIPETTELDTALIELHDKRDAANAAAENFKDKVFDILDVVNFGDATTIEYRDWNGALPNVGDYVLGMKSGALGRIIHFSLLETDENGEITSPAELVLDHIRIGPTTNTTEIDEQRHVRQLDNATREFIEVPYDGTVATRSAVAIDTDTETTKTRVVTGDFTTKVLVNRSSHTPNGSGTTIYEVFQGNAGTFKGVPDFEVPLDELQLEWTMTKDNSFNTFTAPPERSMTQQVFKDVAGNVKDPILNSGYNGKYGHFTGDDIIISFGEDAAQTFLADIEGRNAAEDKITRLKVPPTTDKVQVKSGQTTTGIEGNRFFNMKVTVAGDASIELTGKGGIVESYAVALDGKVNPNNDPATAEARRRFDIRPKGAGDFSEFKPSAPKIKVDTDIAVTGGG